MEQTEGDADMAREVAQSMLADKMTFYVDGKPIEAEVVQGEDADGVVVQTSERVNGHLINQYTREELDALTAPPQQANDNADAARPQSAEAGTEVQNETEEEEKPNEENDAVEASTASKIPQDESGEYDYMQAEPSKAWAALLEQTDGDADMAREVAQSMLNDKVAELEEAQKQQPKEGKSVAEKIAARKEHKANIERIGKEIERWQQILSQSEQQPTTEETKPKEETPSNHIADVSKKEEETTQQENIKLSDEVDENGRQFVLNSEGNLAFGEITEDTGLTAAPILLSEGMITNRATNDGYGLAHIEARHGEEIRKAGYKSVLDFIEQVAKNYDVIKEGNMRDGRPTYRLMLTDKHNNTLMVELSGDGTYWNINTAGIFKTSYGRKNREVYNRHTTVKQSAETTETSQDAEQSDTQAPSRMNVPTTSESEDTKSKAADKEKLDKLGKMGKAVDMKELPKDMAYRETDVNELEDILESGQLRDIPEDKPIEGISDEGVTTRRGRTFNLSRPYGRSHDGKGFAKGRIWTDGGGTLARGTATKVIIGFPGNVTQWREGFHGSYSDAKNFDDIEHGSGLWLPFDENGAVSSLPVKDMKVWVEGEDGKFHEFTPKKPKNEKGEESKADGEKGKGEKIDEEPDAEEKAYLDWKAKDERDLRKKAREYIGSYYDYGGATPPEVCAARALSGIKITPESFRAHTGYSKSEQAKLVGLIAKKENGGVSIDRACELAALEFYEENGYEIDFYEMRDIVLDVLREGNPRGYEKRYLEDEIKKVVDHYKYERDMSYEAEYGMDYDTYMRDPERRKEVLSSAAKSKSQDTDGDRRISVPEDDPFGGGVPDGKVPFHKAGESNRELTKAEVALRDAVVGVLRKSGIDVVSDVSEGQRVLDMANGKERLSGKQKRALETAEQSQRTTMATVVSSADGAKVLNNLDNLAKKLLEKESNRSKTFIGDVARAIGAKEKGSSSQYATFETKNGTVVTIRLANHNAKVSNFDNAGKDNAISIVITRKPNKGMTNDGTAHIVEFFYPETALQRADGKPLAEIVRSIKQALYSGEFKDTTGIAERQEVNGDVVREHRVYHGSGADFEAFDHSHMGEGEGAQAYGWGTYVTEVEGIGRTYAVNNTTKHRDALRALEHDIDAISAQLDMHRNGLKNDEEQLKRANDWRAEAELDYELFQEKAEERKKEYGEDSPEYRNLLFNDIYTDEMKRAQRSVESTEDSIRYRKEKIAELEKALKDKQAEMGELPKKFPRHLYSVEIPEDNGKNYLDWNERLSDSQIEAIRAYLSENYRRNKLEDFDASIAEVKDAPNADEVNAWARRGENVYKMLSHLLGSDEAASKALSEMGFVGIKYPAENRSGGRKDGAKNYVVFNEGDAEIVDKVKFFKTKDGEAYGFTVGGKIYIDPRIASSETAVHEYAHLWAEALRSANAKEWGNVVGLMRGTSVWSEVMERYPELKSDDEIADEVLATYSGRRGSERLRDEMERIKGSDRSVSDKARALGALERVKRALDRFWHGVADFLGIHYKSADEVADRVMRDLLNGVDPRRFVRGESDGRVREQFVGEDGVSDGRGDIPEDAKADLAIENFQQVYADYLEGTERLKEQSDKVSADDNIDAIQGEIKGLEDAYDEAYGELLNALEAMYMAAGVSKVDAKAAAIDRASLSRAEVEMRIIDKRFMKIRSHGAEVRPVKSKVTAIEADSKPKPAEYHSASGNTVSFEGMGGLRKLGKGEFAHVERVFTKSGAFSFSGASKIESIDDVAYIFRNLENYAVENTFAALVKDGVTHVVHLGMGGPVSSMADLSALRGAYDKFGADKIYFVHNHPSGTLRPSQQDVRLFDKIKQMFGSSVEIESLIIDTTSGKFSKIEDGDYRGSTNKKPIGEDVDYEVYAFDRKVYTDMFFDIEDTPKMSSSESVAGFISSHRLGNRKKVSYLVLDNNLNILANIHTNFNGFDNVKGVVDEMVSKCIAYGGRQVVPYGNVDLSGIERVIRGVRISSGDTVGVIDALRIKNGLDYESYNDTHEEAAVYGTHSRTVGDNIEGRGEQGVGKAALQTANERFNSELTRYQNGEMAKNEMLHLGRPQGVMRIFLPDLPIVMRQRILTKGSVRKHNVAIEALADMPSHLSHPIFVFERSDNALGVLTEMQDRDGKNVCVAIELSRKIQNGGEILEVNDVRSVHGRNVADIVYPIVQNGTLKWVDKEKGLTYLSSASQYVQQETDKQDLDNATKVVENFENPKVSDGKRAVDSYDGDLETLFRDADSHVDYERALIRDSYERRMKDAWFQSREALQDGMLSLKETMKDIWRSAGKKFSQITDIPDHANPYLGQNRLSSRNAAEVRDFKRRLFSPLLREVGRLTGFSADGRAKLTDYMMAKHGLERNKVMAERDAKHPNGLTCGP